MVSKISGESYNQMIERHVDDLEDVNGGDVDMMVGGALLTAAFILFAHHDGDKEDIITSLQAAVRRAIEGIESPRFGMPH